MTCLERDDNTSSGIIFVGEIQQKKKYEKNVSFVLDANCHLIVKREKKTKRRNDDMTKGKNTRYEYILLLGNEHLPLSRSNSSISAFAFFPFTVKFLFCSFFPIFKLLVMFMFLAWQSRHYCRINKTCTFSKNRSLHQINYLISNGYDLENQ